MKVNEREITLDFIAKYKAAIKSKLSRQQFAIILGIHPDSLRRRRLAISRETGLDLPQLSLNDSPVKDSQLDSYEKYLTALTVVNATPNDVVIQNKKIYVITSAQNATPVHKNFLAALKNYSEVRDAELLVVPYRYKNPTSLWNTNNDTSEWWDNSLKTHLCSEDLRLAKRLVVMGRMKVQPTAAEPLSGMEAYTGLDSAIFGHPKLQLTTVATPSQTLPKILTTTGSCTLPNYTDSKAGLKGEWGQTLAAAVIEVEDDGTFHLRHVHGDDVTGSFYDLNKFYTTNTVEDVARCAALVTGDTHAEFIDPDVLKGTYLNANSIVKILNPEVIVFHDIVDGYARNHHTINNHLSRFGKHHFGRDNVEEGLQCAADFIDTVLPSDTLGLIVKSNHDEVLDKWLLESDPKIDPENSLLYYYLSYHQRKNMKMEQTKFSTIDPFEFWCYNPESLRGLRSKDNVVFLKRGKSFEVNNIELGFHGDKGSNGARGSIKQFAKIGPKVIIGHSHCLNDNHDVLELNKGWINIKDVIVGDKILSTNNGTNEYVTTDEKFKFFHNGHILTIGGKLWRQEVTEKHNMFLTDGSYKPVCEVIMTEEINKIPLVANAIVSDNTLTIDKNLISKIVALCADGNIQNGRWIRFHVKKQRKINRLQELFGEDLLAPTIGHNGAFKCSIITGSKSYHDMKQYVDFDDKRLPQIFKNLTNELKQHVLDELTYWDGTYKKDIENNSTFQWTTAKKDESNLISSIITELGYRNSCKLKWKDVKNNYGGIYVISWCQNKNHVFYNDASACNKERLSKWELFSEKVENLPVYCLSNKNKNFWVRNITTGQVSLTGNSPGIYDGAMQVGVSARLDLEYNQGSCSSWLHTHCIIYPDGKRTLLNVINGKWKL